MADLDKLETPAFSDPDSMLDELKSRGVNFTTWDGWLKLNSHEMALGKAFEGVERERIKVVDRDEQVGIAGG